MAQSLQCYRNMNANKEDKMSNQGKEKYRISWSEGNYYIWDNETSDWVSDPENNRPLPFKTVKKAEAFVDIITTLHIMRKHALKWNTKPSDMKKLYDNVQRAISDGVNSYDDWRKWVSAETPYQMD